MAAGQQALSPARGPTLHDFNFRMFLHRATPAVPVLHQRTFVPSSCHAKARPIRLLPHARFEQPSSSSSYLLHTQGLVPSSYHAWPPCMTKAMLLSASSSPSCPPASSSPVRHARLAILAWQHQQKPTNTPLGYALFLLTKGLVGDRHLTTNDNEINTK